MFRSLLGGVAVLAMVAGSTVSQAQQATETQTPAAAATTVTPHRHHGMAHRLFKGVNATNDQKVQLKAIHQKYAPQFQTARQSHDRTTMRTLLGQELDEMRGVLTPAQQTTFDANRATIRKHFEQRKAAQSGTPSPDASQPQPQQQPQS